jgi:signal transduction histidine kinase
MRTATSRATQLTTQLLAFSRRAPLRPETVDAAKAVHQAVNLFRRSLPASITLDIELEDGLWPLKADIVHFEMALLNLAVNARDAMKGAGRLRVSARNTTLFGTAALGFRRNCSPASSSRSSQRSQRARAPAWA